MGEKQVEPEIGNLRRAVKAGLDDVEWANEELRRLRTEREELLERQERIAPRPEPMRVNLSLVEECRRAFTEVFWSWNARGEAAICPRVREEDRGGPG